VPTKSDLPSQSHNPPTGKTSPFDLHGNSSQQMEVTNREQEFSFPSFVFLFALSRLAARALTNPLRHPTLLCTKSVPLGHNAELPFLFFNLIIVAGRDFIACRARVAHRPQLHAACAAKRDQITPCLPSDAAVSIGLRGTQQRQFATSLKLSTGTNEELATLSLKLL
jgi:hypothetical protein